MSESEEKRIEDSREPVYPHLRAVDIFPITNEGRQSICLRDPLNIASNMLILPMPAFFIVSMFDGQHSILDIQEIFMQRFQQVVPTETIEDLVSRLDQELFLESDTFYKAMDELKKEFRQSPIRHAAHAGLSYEAEPTGLKMQLDEYLQPLIDNSATLNGNHVDILISPHIDIRRGGECFAYAYRELVSREPADLYIIFGTAHQCRQRMFTLTKKSFETPFGMVETDTNFIDQLSNAVEYDLFEEEFLHRDEHSIEFQVLWLKYVLGDSWNGKIVPILCGSFHPYIADGASPSDDPETKHTLDKIRSLINEYEGKVSIIVGADMSHVGKRFGHAEGIPPAELDRVEREDIDILESMLQGDAEGFYQSIAKNKDRNNVCGLSPIYMSLACKKVTNGRLLKYEQAIEEDTESVVSFASVAFYSESN